MTLRVTEIVIDCTDHGAVVHFWQEALGYARENFSEQYVGLAAAGASVPGRPALLFQKVPEAKVVKNRLHLDLRGDVMTDEVERLKGLGATFVAERSLGSLRWTVMADPEGNEFCVSGEK
jgi:hypothetical protein